MGKYNGAVITTAGANVISQAISGTELAWTVMRSSSVAIPEGTDIAALTSLTGIEQTAAITDASVYGNSTIQVSARFSNTGVSTAYLLETIGIYGQLAGGAETLIAVMTAVTPDQMPVYDADSPSAFIYNSQITVQGAETVVMTVNDTGTATVADLKRKVDLNGGDLSVTVVDTFTASTAEYPVPAAGDTMKVIGGKIVKFCADIVSAVTTLGNNKLDKTGDAQNATIGASTASTASYPIPAAGDSIKVILGKIIKFFTDIKAAYTNVSISGKKITFTTAAGGTKEVTTQDTTYGVVSKTANGLAPQLPNETTTTKYLRQDGSWQVPPNTTYGLASTSANGLLRQLTGNTNQWMRGDGTWQTVQNNATTTAAGYVLDARMGKTLNDKINSIAMEDISLALTSISFGANGFYTASKAYTVPSGKAFIGIVMVITTGNASILTSNGYYQSTEKKLYATLNSTKDTAISNQGCTVVWRILLRTA